MNVGLSLRLTNHSEYDDPRDSLSYDWIRFHVLHNQIPFLVPSGIEDYKKYLSALNLDCFIFTGGDDLIEGKLDNNSLDHRRDISELKLMESLRELNIPIIGVCRGMQFINKYFGGSQSILESKVNHVASEHLITIVADSVFGKKDESFIVNSFHNQIISTNTLASDLVSLGVSEEGFVELAKHKSEKILLMMWHPEREFKSACGKNKNCDFFKIIEGMK